MYMLCYKRKLIVYTYSWLLRMCVPFSCVCLYEKGGANALHIAAMEGHVPVVQLLLDKGAAVEAKISVRYRYRRRPNLLYPYQVVLYNLLDTVQSVQYFV